MKHYYKITLLLIIITCGYKDYYSQSKILEIKKWPDKIVSQTDVSYRLSSLLFVRSDKIASTRYDYSHIFNIHNFDKSVENKSLLELKTELENIPYENNFVIKTNDGETNPPKESKSFFQSEIFYFACAAVLATTAYFIWKRDDTPVSSKTTFGTPPLPQNNN